MYISDLEIKGFKSFALPTKIKFSQGLTCIVGPNGCGKTNIVDAMRWVIGEQKSSVLRGQTMNDVIFSGSGKRKALNYAEVSLSIHNNRGLLPVEYTDVLVTRRLFRDGTSEYYLNKNQCRLKDITELFGDTGMGSDAYSVIELKMVESILSDSKEDRRQLFEESAGINKYKKQRRLSLRRLETTEIDLNRVQDIKIEVEKNVGNLKRQLSKYKRYESVQSQLKENEILLAKMELSKLFQDISPMENQWKDLSQGFGSSGSEVDHVEKLLADYRGELNSLEQDLNDQRHVVGQLNGETQEAERSLLLADEKISNSTSSLDRIGVEEETLEEKRNTVYAVKQKIQNDMAHLDPQLSGKLSQLESVKKLHGLASDRYNASKKEFETRTGKNLELITDIADLKSKKVRQDDLLVQLRNQIKRIDEKLLAVLAKSKGYQEELKLASFDYDKSKKILVDLETKATDQENSFKQLQTNLNETRENLAAKRGERVSIENQLAFYEELIASGEGYSSGVRAIVHNSKNLTGILGTVADLIVVDEKYEHALQASLGTLAEVIVTTDRKSAENAIGWLNQGKKGVATFLPLKELNLSKVTLDKELLDNKHILGAAKNFIKAKPEHEKLVALFFNDLLLADNEFEPDWKYSKGRVVRLDGTVFNFNGTLKGGSGVGSKDTIVGRKHRLENLRKRFTTLSETIEKLTDDVQKFHLQVGQADKDYRQTRTARNNQRQVLQEFDRKTSRAQFGVSASEADKKSLENEKTQLETSIAEGMKKAEAYLPEIEKLKSKKSAISAEIEAMETSLAKHLSDRDRAGENVQQAQLEVVHLQNEEKNLKLRLTSITETEAESQKREEMLKLERHSCELTLKENTAIRFESETKIATLKSILRKERDSLKSIEERLATRRATVTNLEMKLQDERHKRETVAEKIKDLEVALAELKATQKHIQGRIEEKYNLQIVPEILNKDDLPNFEDIQKEILRSQRFIENLGPVNLAVQDEYDVEFARLNFLNEQYADLIEAKSSLTETISKLDRMARKQFKETFAQIQEHFTGTFQMLFDGGLATISLEDPDHPLESDIIIQATPKGKKTQHLKMLSAGEKALTAIALLFAIYQVKPSPYCVLDEIDAPLDDRNIKKFTQMLESFSGHTQFIVITHNKMTMESAKYLYGVTMEEEGISKLVSVQFN